MLGEEEEDLESTATATHRARKSLDASGKITMERSTMLSMGKSTINHQFQ